MNDEELLVHYWQLPDDLFVSLKEEFHNKLCYQIQVLTKHYKKNCFYKVLNCPKWHAQRLFTKFTRIRLSELEIIREYANISKEEVEISLEEIGNHEDGTIIKNPKLPFKMINIFYVASHLMFDGCFMPKKGCYFLCYGDSLFDYHTNRLKVFGEVPTNYIEKKHQLYFSYTIAYIVSKMLKISDFRSMKVFLSDKFKSLVKENKILLDEFIKAMITDEGAVDDKIRIELGNNEKFVKDIYEVVSIYYKLNKLSSRERFIRFKENPKWNYKTTLWKIDFSTESFIELHRSLGQLPIGYKQRNFDFLLEWKSKRWNQRRVGESKKLILKSLLKKPKSIQELSNELLVKNNVVSVHLKGNHNKKNSLYSLGIVEKIGEEILHKGGFARRDIYGIIDEEKAKEYIKNITTN